MSSSAFSKSTNNENSIGRNFRESEGTEVTRRSHRTSAPLASAHPADATTAAAAAAENVPSENDDRAPPPLPVLPAQIAARSEDNMDMDASTDNNIPTAPPMLPPTSSVLQLPDDANDAAPMPSPFYEATDEEAGVKTRGGSIELIEDTNEPGTIEDSNESGTSGAKIGRGHMLIRANAPRPIMPPMPARLSAMRYEAEMNDDVLTDEKIRMKNGTEKKTESIETNASLAPSTDQNRALWTARDDEVTSVAVRTSPSRYNSGQGQATAAPMSSPQQPATEESFPTLEATYVPDKFEHEEVAEVLWWERHLRFILGIGIILLVGLAVAVGVGLSRRDTHPDGNLPITQSTDPAMNSIPSLSPTTLQWRIQSSVMQLAPSEDVISHRSGISVAVYGDTAVVGAPANDDHKGATFVFARGVDGEWSQQAKLTAPDGAANDLFGHSVSIYQDTIVIDAPADDDNGKDSGSSYVFVRNGTSWSLQAKLSSPDGAAYDYFGTSVSIYEDTIVVGRIGSFVENNIHTRESGSAHVFVRNDTVWSHQAEILPSDGFAEDWFGISVAIYENTIVVGACGDRSIHVLVRSNTVWSLEAKLSSPSRDAYDCFGKSVSIYKDTIVVGAPNDDRKGPDTGSSYVFVRNNAIWSLQERLYAQDGAANEFFGDSVSIYKDAVVIGAWGDGVSVSESGLAHMYVRKGARWSHVGKLLPPDCAAGDWFGQSLAIHNGAIVGNSPGGGKSYLFSG